MPLLLGLAFPPIGDLVEWKSFWLPGFNKPVLVVVLAALLPLALFVVASRQRSDVPTGARNVAEMVVEFVRDQIILQSIGEEGLVFLPYLTSVFLFIFVANIFEVLPFIQFPANARMAFPLMLTAITYVLCNVMGVRKQGWKGHLRASCGPLDLSGGMLVIVAPIELLTNFILRPFGLAVRLFANMLAGHLLLVTFAVLTDALVHSSAVPLKALAVVPFAVSVVLTGFEVLVSGL